MGIREITGYIAHVLLAGYWLWVILSTAPQLRRGARDQRVRTQVLLIKTAAVGLTAAGGRRHPLLGHALVAGGRWRCRSRPGSGWLLHRAYRRLVALPRHRRRAHPARPHVRARRYTDRALGTLRLGVRAPCSRSSRSGQRASRPGRGRRPHVVPGARSCTTNDVAFTLAMARANGVSPGQRSATT